MLQKAEILPLTPQEVRAIGFASKHAVSTINEVDQWVQERMRQLVIKAIQERWSSQKLETVFFDQFGELNLDWRTIAITELATASNNAFLLGCDEGDRVYSPSIANSCEVCTSLLEGREFIVTHRPLSEIVKIPDYGTKYLWAGKTNVGRKYKDWWSCVPLHSCCRHRLHKFSRFYAIDPNHTGKPKLRDLKDLINEERASRGLPPDPNL